MIIRLLLFIFVALSVNAQFTEFYVQSTGSNLNAGSTTSNTAAFTYASGNWVASTGVFTVASGNPSSDGVTTGMFASVYADGSTETGFVGRVTAVSTTTITVSLTAKSGTAPTDGTGNRTLKVGGAWAGPSGTSGFPYNLAAGTMSNSSGNPPRVNFLAGTYSVTAAITHSIDAGPIWFEGYTSTPGDDGYAVIDGGTSGASYVVLTISGKNLIHRRFKFNNNGATGSANGVYTTGNENAFIHCVFSNMRGLGIYAGSVVAAIACEAFGCNQSNSSSKGGMQFLSSGTVIINCISHDNTTANSTGFFLDQSMTIIGCIADSNGLDGFSSAGDVNQTYLNCDAYNNGRHGFNQLTTAAMTVNFVNCNAVKNTQYGIVTSTSAKGGLIINCGFGSGSQANGSGDVSEAVTSLRQVGKITYTSGTTPWVDPANGDFRISSSQAKGQGWAPYTQTASSYSGTAGYPDVGSAQHQETSSGGQKAYAFSE